MRLDPRRADSVIVERVVDQEIVGVPLLDDALHVLQGESARALAVAGLTRSPIAAERLLFEELLATVIDPKLVTAGELLQPSSALSSGIIALSVPGVSSSS